jgi:hypothetical protein
MSPELPLLEAPGALNSGGMIHAHRRHRPGSGAWPQQESVNDDWASPFLADVRKIRSFFLAR